MEPEQAFAQRFADTVKQPTPERMVETLHPDVVLYQPHLPAIRGKDAALREFQHLFRWLPNFHGEVERSMGSDGVVFIEWQMNFPIGKRGVVIRAVDRFLLQDDLAIERAVYFNQLPLIMAVLTHPQTWPAYMKYSSGQR